LPASKAGHFLKSYFDDEDFGDKDEDLKEMKEETGVTYDYLIMNDFNLPLNKDNETKKEELVNLLKESVFKTVSHDIKDHGHTDKNLTISNSTVEFYSEDMSNI